MSQTLFWAEGSGGVVGVVKRALLSVIKEGFNLGQGELIE